LRGHIFSFVHENRKLYQKAYTSALNLITAKLFSLNVYAYNSKNDNLNLIAQSSIKLVFFKNIPRIKLAFFIFFH